MRVAVVAIASVVVLALGGSASAMAEGLGSLTSPSPAAAGVAKAAPARGLQKSGAGQSRQTAPPPGLERASGSERDNPVLNLLWLLTGTSGRH